MVPVELLPSPQEMVAVKSEGLVRVESLSVKLATPMLPVLTPAVAETPAVLTLNASAWTT